MRATIRAVHPVKQVEIYKYILSKCTPLIDAWKSGNGVIGESVPIPQFTPSDLANLFQVSLQLIKQQPPVLILSPGVIIVGDLHGNFINLIHILAQHGLPPEQRYLFLGNIINFGEFSLETITLIYALFCSYPSHISILRGDTELFPIQTMNSLYFEINNTYQDISLFETITNTFAFLPIAALFDNRVLCTQTSTLLKYNSIAGMMQLHGPVFCEISNQGFNGYTNSQIPEEDFLFKFIEKNQIDLMILGGNIQETGISSYCEEHVFSIATCESRSAAGVMLLTGDFKPSPIIFVTNSELERGKARFQIVDKILRKPAPVSKSPSGPIARANIVIPGRSNLTSGVMKFHSATPKPNDKSLNRSLTLPPM
ncbi:Ser/Thr protein phosphatase, putative [Trichomonas vaginalis G3]|uniref:protein-serine/threonine phosphatase n=1 Tax=Trichomonas vaginalis (strain ATCC PRA-98 / G3) TaxID=412133 RepID=A2FQ56_TRIV3|nr:phosphoprotein phosphatase protein [Trichomonas vaginalis G3]EAX92963.1 Ser/Thr protein phosphatase, putative [Trichomonas vaginalis G3]KAI5512352.1 phosphoprotein phosphatase protein [Trichomonas vaginalis G3]|eukprot:XP_001305893.1 Ser/Thr protein phosphatase [Trichomonas vaginalis G3]